MSRATGARPWVLFAGIAALVLAVGILLAALALNDDTSDPGGGGSGSRAAEAGRVVGAPIRVGHSPSGLAAGELVMWVASEADEAVLAIDPSLNDVVGEPVHVRGRPRYLTTGAGSVWVSGLDSNVVTRIDPDGVPRASIPVGDSPAGVAPAQ
jgi:DNA-binding beta-propeller fold protein YncE